MIRGPQASEVFPVLDTAWKAFTATVTGNTTTAERLAGLTEGSFSRPAPFEERVVAQAEATKLPILPTTTIGSFPQARCCFGVSSYRNTLHYNRSALYLRCARTCKGTIHVRMF